MDVTFLAVSIGNTRTKLGAFVKDNLEASQSIENRDERTIVDALRRLYDTVQKNLPDGDAAVLMASVSPATTERIEHLIEQELKARRYRVSKDLPIPIGRQLDADAIVGEDRLLNAAAAYDRLKQAVIVVDAGTALTVDFVDGAGTFHGGAIAPGWRMALSAMHGQTAQLPEVEPAAPREAVGHNTVEAMRTGTYHGMRGTVRELVEHFAEVAGVYPMVIATGGDAETLFGDYDLVERVVPDLTLLGLAATFRVGVKGGEDDD